MGLNPDTFGEFILICLFINFAVILLGLAISAFAPNADAAAAMGPPFLIIGILFGGFYVKIDTLPIVLNWIPYISVFQWGFRGLCVNEFAGETFSCDTSPDQCMTKGEEVLRALDFDGHTVNYAMFGLGMLMLCYLAGLYILLVLNEAKFLKLGHVGSSCQVLTGTMSSSEKNTQVLEMEMSQVEFDAEAKPTTYQLLYREEEDSLRREMEVAGPSSALEQPSEPVAASQP